MMAPLHIGQVNGHQVRFYRDPSGHPALPWHSAEDIYLALGLPRHVRREFQRMTQRHWPGEVRTIGTADGIVTVAPHHVAQGVIGAAIEVGAVPAEIATEYAMAGAAALNKLVGDLPLASVMTFVANALQPDHDGGGR